MSSSTTARDITILDLLHHGYHPPSPAHPDHERLMAEWTARYRARVACAEAMLEAVAQVEEEAPCPPSP